MRVEYTFIPIDKNILYSSENLFNNNEYTRFYLYSFVAEYPQPDEKIREFYNVGEKYNEWFMSMDLGTVETIVEMFNVEL